MSSGGDLHSSSSSNSLNNDEEGGANLSASAPAPTTASTAAAPPSLTPELKVENNPDAGIWITSQGVFYFKLNTLHIHLQFFYSVLRVSLRLAQRTGSRNDRSCICRN